MSFLDTAQLNLAEKCCIDSAFPSIKSFFFFLKCEQTEPESIAVTLIDTYTTQG